MKNVLNEKMSKELSKQVAFNKTTNSLELLPEFEHTMFLECKNKDEAWKYPMKMTFVDSNEALLKFKKGKFYEIISKDAESIGYLEVVKEIDVQKGILVGNLFSKNAQIENEKIDDSIRLY